jgi:hypothetical protein
MRPGREPTAQVKNEFKFTPLPSAFMALTGKALLYGLNIQLSFAFYRLANAKFCMPTRKMLSI